MVALFQGGGQGIEIQADDAVGIEAAEDAGNRRPVAAGFDFYQSVAELARRAWFWAGGEEAVFSEQIPGAGHFQQARGGRQRQS